MEDPFGPQPVSADEPTGLEGAPESSEMPQKTKRKLSELDVYYNEVDKAGNVCKYKRESGVPVKVADLGNIRDYFNVAIMKAAMMSPEDVETADFGAMTHIEIAAIRLAGFAAAGDIKSTQELFDRVLGKAKQVSQSTQVSMTIDDILNGIQVNDPAIDV